MKMLLTAAALLSLTACGSKADDAADSLENAAAQMDPAAAAVAMNEADAIRNQDDAGGNLSNDAVQDALQNAGDAQVGKPVHQQP